MKIAGKEYNLKYTLRSLVVYEELTGAPFEPGLLKNEIILYYAVIIANNPGTELTFERFFETLDGENLLPALREWLLSQTKKLNTDDDKPDEGNKKKE
jgi:hypothetical protein